jgi:hypothetical protein
VNNQINVRGASNKYLLAGVTVSAAIVLAKPIFPLTALAATNQYDWTKQEDLDPLGGQYTSAAQSADGSALMLGISGGGEEAGDPAEWAESPLYISSNSGVTWENIADEADPGIQNHWSSVDVSNNGQVMVASSDFGHNIDEFSGESGKIILSEDGGDTWNDITPADTDNWESVLVSGDGSKIIALETSDEDVYISDDGGDNWATTTLADVWNLKSISVSDDGGTILLGGENSESASTRLFITEDDGDNWDDISPNSSDDAIYYNEHDISADGEKVIVSTLGWSGDGYDGVFVSSNKGLNWEEASPDNVNLNSWVDTSISDNGSVLSMLDEDGAMYVSSNFGASWTEEDPGQDYEDTNTWASADFNNDGSQAIVASETNAYLGIEGDFGDDTTVTLDDAEGGKTIVVTTPAGTTITCHSAVKESVLDVTDIAFSYPLGLVDFCFNGAEANNEVSLVFVTDLKADEIAVRKYDPATNQYTTVTEATVTETTYESQPALQVTYNIVDNGPLDLDPDDGEVADPVGIAVQEIESPNTGKQKHWLFSIKRQP